MKQLRNITRSLIIALLMVTGAEATAQQNPASDNRVAILPINYIGEGNDAKMEEMRYKLQNIAHQFLQKESFELKFQDPAETNALLLKHGVTQENFRQFLPNEIAGFLKVEYVLMATVMEENGAVISHYNGEVKQTRRVDKYPYEHHSRNKERYAGSSSTRQEINTTIDLAVYNDKGEKMYSRSRRSLLSDPGTYKAGLQYLLKRSPLYKK